MAYLDHAASSPMRAAAADATAAALLVTGNPSSLHTSGRSARRVLEESRERLAAALGARPGAVVFTSGGTEADNLAIKGLFWAARATDPGRDRVLVSAAEHHAVLDAAAWLATHEGARVELIPVDSAGRVTPDVLRPMLGDGCDVALVSVMWANNETGTVNPIAELTELAHDVGVPVHSDAVQAVGALPVAMDAAGVDALAVSAHKLGGPHGIGALVLSRSAVPVPLLHGGGQERDVRSGTPPVPLAVGMSVAAAEAVAGAAQEAARLMVLRDELVSEVLRTVPDAEVNGALADGGPSLPGLANIWFPGCEGDALLMLLDARGVECSTGSACTAGIPEASHVLLASGASSERARGSLRFSLGHTSTMADVDGLLDALPAAVERARRAGMLRTAIRPGWIEA